MDIYNFAGTHGNRSLAPPHTSGSGYGALDLMPLVAARDAHLIITDAAGHHVPLGRLITVAAGRPLQRFPGFLGHLRRRGTDQSAVAARGPAGEQVPTAADLQGMGHWWAANVDVPIDRDLLRALRSVATRRHWPPRGMQWFVCAAWPPSRHGGDPARPVSAAASPSPHARPGECPGAIGMTLFSTPPHRAPRPGRG